MTVRRILFTFMPVALCAAAFAYYDFEKKSVATAIQRQEQLVSREADRLRRLPIDRWQPSSQFTVGEYQIESAGTVMNGGRVNIISITGDHGMPLDLLKSANVDMRPVTIGNKSAAAFIKQDGAAIRRFFVVTSKRNRG